MVKKSNVFSGKIKDKAVFNFAELYRFCYTWLVDEDYEVQEDTYSEKVNPNGKEVEIQWTAKKKISDYFRNELKFVWRIIGLKDVEVQKNGEKLSMNKGALEIKVSATLEMDYESKWEDRPFFKFLRKVYNRYIIKGRIEQYEEKIFSDADEILAQIKSFLSLEGDH